jgi:hypothetical protein
MVKDQFIRLKNNMVIFDPIEDKMAIVKSSFIDPDKVEDDDVLLCHDFFVADKEISITVKEHGNWVQFRADTFMDDLSQGLINKLLLKKIMVLETKLKNASLSLK